MCFDIKILGIYQFPTSHNLLPTTYCLQLTSHFPHLISQLSHQRLYFVAIIQDNINYMRNYLTRLFSNHQIK